MYLLTILDLEDYIIEMAYRDVLKLKTIIAVSRSIVSPPTLLDPTLAYPLDQGRGTLTLSRSKSSRQEYHHNFSILQG